MKNSKAKAKAEIDKIKTSAKDFQNGIENHIKVIKHLKVAIKNNK